MQHHSRRGELDRFRVRLTADAGLATAEFAVLMPAVLAFVLMLASVLAAAAAHVSVANATREASRMISRGESTSTINQGIRRAAVGVADVDIQLKPEGSGVWVEVSGSPRHMPGPLQLLLPRVRARLWVASQ